MGPVTLDHIAVAATALEAGVAATEAALGLALAGGGRHAAMGTHNRLMGLGDTYLEVIAIDPEAPGPGRPRWFDLDRFAGPPRLTNWILRCDDLEAALARAPAGCGRPMAFERNGLRWRMAVPKDGILPFGGLFPALIQWEGEAAGPDHPRNRLPVTGARLARLSVVTPEAAAFGAALAPLLDDARVEIMPGLPRLSALIETPHGVRAL